MPRFERADTSRFWEVDIHDYGGQPHVVTRHGKLGTDGRTSPPKPFSDIEQAEKDVARRVRAKLKEGYEECEPPREPGPVDIDQETEIASNPYEIEPYLVYADWLQAHENPRGELISVQAAIEAKPADRKLERRQKDLYADHSALALPEKIETLARIRRRKNTSELGYTEVRWRWGFIHSARVARNTNKSAVTVREAVRDLLTHPSGRLLVELDVGPLGSHGTFDYGPIVELIGRYAPPSLRRLRVGVFTAEHSELGFCTVGKLHTLSHLPHLRELSVRGSDAELGSLHSPSIRTLKVELLNADALRSALAHDACLPGLTELSIVGTRSTATMLRALMAEAPDRLRRLQTLALPGGDLQDEDIETVLALAAFDLSRLDVSRNRLTSPERLDEIAGEVVANDQRPPSAGGPEITDELVHRLAPDSKSVSAARKHASAGAWQSFGWDQGGPGLWGTCRGSAGTYLVWVDLTGYECACTCPSRKYPCKHALGLLLMAAQGDPIPVQNVPDGHLDTARMMGQHYYESVWE